MPQCGNCGKPVAGSDVTCPHCDVLLAAYASVAGAGAPSAYVPSAEPPPTEIPSVDMEVPPPSDTPVVTNPTDVAEEPVSTAPRPLFDTYLTVEEIARAAEGDHADDVVTISERKIATRNVEFDVPDYARPPSDAAPIPVVDDADASTPMITRDSAPSNEPRDIDVHDAPPHAGENWLDAAAMDPKPIVAPKASPNPKGTAVAKPAATSAPNTEERVSGTTDTYLRRLHAETGYVPKTIHVSKPVLVQEPTPVERTLDWTQRVYTSSMKGEEVGNHSMAMGCASAYILALVLSWIVMFFIIVTGNASTTLILLLVAATGAFKSVMRKIEQVDI